MTLGSRASTGSRESEETVWVENDQYQSLYEMQRKSNVRKYTSGQLYIRLSEKKFSLHKKIPLWTHSYDSLNYIYLLK